MKVAPAGDDVTTTATFCARASGANARQPKTAANNANLAATLTIQPNWTPGRLHISDTKSLDSEVSILVKPQKYTTNFGNGGITSHFDH
jgi:hypothetical protein